MPSPMDVAEAFRAEMEAAGVPAADGGRIIPDGKLRRFRVEGESRGKRSGWYVLHADGRPAGRFGDWRTGADVKWRMNGRAAHPPTDRQRTEAAQLERRNDELLERRAGWLKAARMWEQGTEPDPANPYLRLKQVGAHGIRQLGDGLLLVPVRAADGELRGMQRIWPDGSKRFTKGSAPKGCFHLIGEPGDVLAVAEGYATAATVHEAAGHPVAVAFNRGNLLPVARALRGKYPAARLLIAGDDDRGTEGNPGRTDATAAAGAVGAVVAFPPFDDGDAGSDWNDWAAAHGGEAVAERIAAALAEPVEVEAAEEGADEFDRTDAGAIVKNSQTNVRLALDRLGVTLTHDVFADRLLIHRDGAPAEHLSDAIIDRLWLEIDERFGFRPSVGFFRTVVEDHARQSAFHPVTDYLDALTWDGVPRLDRWLVEYGGAEDTGYSRAVGPLTLIAAVRRVRHPGSKFDEMLVLESEQGTDKSTALRTLAVAEEWFDDDLPLGSSAQKVIEQTTGKWILEAAELAGMSRRDVESLKAFLSRQTDRARLAYGRQPTERPRHFVVIGTTNSDRYLKDTTGNRRFWPVKVEGFDLAALRRNRDQLWAEAAHREAEGASIRLDPALYDMAATEQERRRADDPWETRLSEVLDGLTGKLAIEDAWRIVGMADVGRRAQYDNDRLGAAMRRLGFERRRLRHAGERGYFYVHGDERPLIRLHMEGDRVVGATGEAPF